MSDKTPLTEKLIDGHGQEFFYGDTEENARSLVWGHYLELQNHAKMLEMALNFACVLLVSDEHNVLTFEEWQKTLIDQAKERLNER